MADKKRFKSQVQMTALNSQVPLWTKTEVITNGTTPRTLTAAETNTVFLIDDAALVLVLPAVSDDTVGVKYKFLVTDKEITGFTIKSQGNGHYFSGYALITKEANEVEHFVPDGNSNSEINLNGGTTGGKNSGGTGDTPNINQIVATCISGDAGAAWFVEAQLHGSGGIATPFDDQ